MLSRIIKTLCFGVLVSAAPLSASGIGGTLSPKDANVLIPLQEAPATALALLGMFVGGDPFNNLPWSGTVSDSGWSVALFAPYRDGSLTMNYSGALNLGLDLATWSGTGSFVNPFGSFSWTSNGSYTHATVDGGWLDAFAIVIIAGVTVFGDAVVAGAQGVTTVASVGALGAPAIAASGTAVAAITTAGVGGIVLITKNDQGRINTTVQQSPANAPFVPPYPIDAPGLIRQPNYPGIMVVSSSQLTGNYADPVVFVSGTSSISDTPEPTPALMIGTGALVLFGLGWRHRRRPTRASTTALLDDGVGISTESSERIYGLIHHFQQTDVVL